MPNIHKIAKQSGIALRAFDKRKHGQLPKKTTFAKKTIRQIARRYGENHMHNVFDLFLTNSENEKALHYDTIKAVSLWLVNNNIHPHEMPAVKEQFKNLDLRLFRSSAVDSKLGYKSIQIATLLNLVLSDFCKQRKINV